MRKLIKSAFLKNVIPHFIITLIFVIISLLFYYPLLSGKKLVQSDIIQYKGMSKQLNDFRIVHRAERSVCVGGQARADASFLELFFRS